MKMHYKKNLTYKNGMIVTDDGDIIAIDPEIVEQANKIEELNQKNAWLKEQPAMCPGPDFDLFERKHEFDMPKFEYETPLLDSEAEKTLALMHEIDMQGTASVLNDNMSKFKKLLDFTSNDYIVDNGNGPIDKFDCPTLGNPLEWTHRTIGNVLAASFGLASNEDEDGE